MMSMPYIVLATFGSIAYVSIRRARLASPASADGTLTVSEAPLPPICLLACNRRPNSASFMEVSLRSRV